ncbi:MAG: aminopeptidase P family N-terminal domain-containing protein, partial [Planctomycetota bacterium]
MSEVTTPAAERVRRLQDELASSSVHALVVPSSDPHLSEYLPERWSGRAWVSGFTGSVGTLVVTTDRAALFADSRYWVQAEAQLEGSGIELVKIATAASANHLDWLGEAVPEGGVVAVDGTCLGLAAERSLRRALERRGIELRTDRDLLDGIWGNRPALPNDPVYEHTGEQAVRTRAANLAEVRSAMAHNGATHHLVSTVDDLAWIFGLRGSDVAYNPVFLAHALIEAERTLLFIESSKVDAELERALLADGVELRPYAEAAAAVEALGEESRLMVDPSRVTFGLVGGSSARLIETVNPSTLAKSRKTERELAFVREAMEQDGAAMCEFYVYAWFEAALGRERITELTIDERLTRARAARPGFVGLSFPTIAGFNANGALPHYRATEESHAVIEGDGLLLIDSGGQYLGGTTDITRVWGVGSVSD